MKFILLIIFFIPFSLCLGVRPNILWITAEDMSPVIGCYGNTDAITPNIDAFAKESIKYSNAFASAPVCSPSRSCLIQGCYPTSLGTQQMRSGFPLPSYMKGFPALLHKKGYYSTNNVKTDYNSGNYKEIIQSSWDESSGDAHWRSQKSEAKPFFSVFNDFPPEPNDGVALLTFSKGNSIKINQGSDSRSKKNLPSSLLPRYSDNS